MSKSASTSESRLFDLYDELDKLEELLEDMALLGVCSFEEAEARIEHLNASIDSLEAGDASK